MCVFCSIVKGKIPSKKVYEDEKVIAILDLSQATKGHTLIIPKQHFENIYDVDEETLSHIIKVAKKVACLLTEKLHADGCNILNNNKEAAGQTVNHLHFHVIPRYKDDDLKINFVEHPCDLEEVLKQII